MGILEKVFGIKPKRAPLSIDEQNFEREVLRSELPVLLDVWGPSCGPCKQLEPIIFDLTNHYDGRVKVCELSAQASPRIAHALSIQATPTVLYFKGGLELERVHGFRSSLFHKQTIQDLFAIDP